MITLEQARELAAEAWCQLPNENKAMDADLAESFARILQRQVNQAARAWEIDKSRRVMVRCFMEDRDFLRSYRDNVAMVLHDSIGPLPPDKRNLAALEVLRRIFDAPFGDPDQGRAAL